MDLSTNSVQDINITVSPVPDVTIAVPAVVSVDMPITGVGGLRGDPGHTPVKGIDYFDGGPGPAGPANSLSIGTVTSSATPSASITGTAPSQTLNLVLSKGDPGAAGPANSLSIGTVSQGTAAATITGAAPSQTLNLTLPKGDTGAAATIAVGTVTTGAAGTPVAITNAGSSSAAVFNFTIPKGDTGAAGAGTGDMLAANNLSDLTNTTTARTNLGLGSLATQSGTFSGTSSGTNTGDETLSTIKTKLGITTLSGSNTGDQTNVTGTAANITGTLAVSQGGTGATATTGTGNNVLAVSPSLTTPKADFITDTNGGKEIELVTTASSANWVRLTNSVTGSGVTIGANGTGANENLSLAALGTGTVQVGGSQVTTAANTQTLTNKSISGASNTLSAIPESAVTNLPTDLAAKAPLASPSFTGTVGSAGQISSTLATGTAPLAVASTTKVTNLNADMVDGIHASSTPTANQLYPLNASALFDWSVLPLGAAVQVVNSSYSAVATGTNTIPFDDTPPQITEGNEYMTVTITPKAVTDVLIVQANFLISNSTAGSMSAALFQDATVNALAAQSQFMATATGRMNFTLVYKMAAGTTAATTFRLRAGNDSAGTTTFNGANGTRIFGGITLSTLTVYEYKA